MAPDVSVFSGLDVMPAAGVLAVGAAAGVVPYCSVDSVSSSSASFSTFFTGEHKQRTQGRAAEVKNPQMLRVAAAVV